MSDLLLKICNLIKIFPVKAGAFSSKKLQLKAVNQVSFDLKKGEVLGLVGESGCGKTTLGRCLNRLYEPSKGRVFINPDEKKTAMVIGLDDQIEDLETRIMRQTFDLKKGSKNRNLGKEVREMKQQTIALKKEADLLALGLDILTMPRGMLKKCRKNIQMIFQDPWASLNPRMLVKDIIGEGLREFNVYKGRKLDKEVRKLIDIVGLPTQAATRYPHEFSGGQRQRIGIARAIALNPSLIICDEPVSALDVSIQAQILNLLISLQQEYQLTYIFIAHDLGVVHYISDRIGVMYLGRMVEIGDANTVYMNPRHPYTKSLLAAIPVADPEIKKEEIILEGDIASPVNPPSGCTFHPRCNYKTDICTKEKPELKPDHSRHYVACFNLPNF